MADDCETCSNSATRCQDIRNKPHDNDDDAFPPVVAVNVGGTLFTTTLSTLCRYPESLLGVMFSGRHRILRDACGRPFIDFDPDRFRPVLEFLRTETLPPSDRSVDVYQAAAYFAVEPLRERLTCFAPVARMLVQTSYRDRFRNYEQLRYHVVKTATEKAAVDAGHRTIVRVLIKRGTSTHDDTDKDHMCVRSEADFDLESFKVTAADAAADAVSGATSTDGGYFWDTYDDDLLRCVRHDLGNDGFSVSVGVYNRQFCAAGCPFSVEKFEFQF